MISITGSEYEKYKDRMVKRAFWVIHVTDGTDNWYFSTVDMDLTDGHVYPLLKKEPQIKEKIDYYTKRWSVSDLLVEINNAPYTRISGTMTRVSENFDTELIGQTVKAYYILGGQVAALSNAMLRFEGQIEEHPEYTEQSVTLRAVDKGKTIHKRLPINTIRSNWADAPNDSLDKKIPLVYGRFSYGADLSTDTGLAIGVKIDNDASPTYVFSDHALDAITDSYAKVQQLPEPSELEDSTHTANNSGYGTAKLTLAPASVSGKIGYDSLTRIYPVDNFTGDYDLSPASNEITNYKFSFDGDKTTYADILDYSGTTDMSFRAVYCFPDFSSGEAYDNEIGWMFNVIGTVNGWQLEYKIERGTWTPDIDGTWATTPFLRIYYTYSGGDVFWSTGNLDETSIDNGTEDTLDVNYVTNPPALRDNVAWHWRSGSDVNTGDAIYPTLLYIGGTSNGGGTGTTLDQTVVKIYQVRLAIRHWVMTPENIFLACDGLAYGSWISSRSSNYASGDYIKDPAGIIESVLRDHLGLASADLDLPSFIAAENTSMAHQYNLHSDNEYNSDDFIRLVCEQSTFAFYYSGAGKARLINMKYYSPTNPTTDVTIPYSHIQPGSITVGKTKWIINSLEADYVYHQEKGRTVKNDTTTNSTSITNYGTREYKAKWKNISGDTSRDELYSHLIDTTDQGFWANPQTTIKLVVHPGYAHLEVGDWIELDDETVDPHILCHGQSWGNQQFIIDEVNITSRGVTISAQQLGT